jgi:hypothetical protein
VILLDGMVLIDAKESKPTGGDYLLLTASKVWTIGDWYVDRWRTLDDTCDGKRWIPAHRPDDITHWTRLPTVDEIWEALEGAEKKP